MRSRPTGGSFSRPGQRLFGNSLFRRSPIARPCTRRKGAQIQTGQYRGRPSLRKKTAIADTRNSRRRRLKPGPIGLFGGTFDPLHKGHLLAAKTAFIRLKLARVIFIPAASPPHKRNEPVSAVRHRYRMVKLGIAPYPYFSIAGLEMKRKGPSFTIDTVRAMRRRFPKRALYFIVGSDTVPNIPSWRRYRELLREVVFAVVFRPGHPLRKLPGFNSSFVLIPAPGIDISARRLRKHLAEGRAAGKRIPAAVEKYIRRRKLYIKKETL